MTIHLEVVEQVDQPADRIFTLLTDVRRQPEWIDEVEAVVPPSTPLAVGTAYEQSAKYYGRSVTIQQEVLAIEPNHLIRLKSTGAMPTITTWRLEPDGSGTRLHLTFEGEPGELYDMISAGMEGQIKRGFQTQIKNLAALIAREST
jgi:uncharacterized protein YndB with AHSA1/START domain